MSSRVTEQEVEEQEHEEQLGNEESKLSRGSTSGMGQLQEQEKREDRLQQQ